MKTILGAAGAALALAALGGCGGSVPRRDAPPEQEMAAILISGRMILPSGETRDGAAAVNFETDGGARAEVYRLPLRGNEKAFYLIQPGTYRLARTRSFFGSTQHDMTVMLGGRRYKVPFPSEILRQPKYKIRPKTVVALGVLEVRALPSLPGQMSEIRVRLDDSAQSRRQIVQDAINELSDPRRSFGGHEDSIYWSRALQNCLIGILAEENAPAKSSDQP